MFLEVRTHTRGVGEAVSLLVVVLDGVAAAFVRLLVIFFCVHARASSADGQSQRCSFSKGDVGVGLQRCTDQGPRV